MRLTDWTVYPIGGGRPKRSGRVDEDHVDSVAYDPKTERLALGIKASLREERVVEAAGKLTVERLPEAEIEARRPRRGAPITLEVVLEALNAKGIVITEADLEAAAASLQVRRTPPARAGK
jgi:hypothetical protein